MPDTIPASPSSSPCDSSAKTLCGWDPDSLETVRVGGLASAVARGLSTWASPGFTLERVDLVVSSTTVLGAVPAVSVVSGDEHVPPIYLVLVKASYGA